MAIRAITRRSMNARNERMKQDFKIKSHFQSHGSCYSTLQLDENKNEWEDAHRGDPHASKCRALQANIQEMLGRIAV
jgi:hypothetical protein